MLLGLASCLDGDNARALGSGCTDEEGCEPDLVCLYGRCRSDCAFDRDCPTGSTCVPDTADSSVRACMLPDEGEGSSS
jgi:hypothetical protein